MSRRDLLATAALAPLSSIVARATGVRPPKQVTFVLVHGAWHGGWCWKKLTPLLQAAGHQVVAPTMTGLGERSHLLTADVDLQTHINDIAAVLECDDLENVVLVGHSYGGIVIAGVAARTAVRLARVVYVDAFLPDDGKSLKDYAPVPPTRADGWRVPPPGPPRSFGVTDARDVAWMEHRLGDQPVKTFTQPVLRTASISASNHTFIQCTKAPFFADASERAKQRGFHHYELMSGGHDAMITEPAALSRILLGVV